MLSGDIEPNPGPVHRLPRGPMNLDVGFKMRDVNELQIGWSNLCLDP